MSFDIGWRYLASRIMKAGFAARIAPGFDVWAEARAIDERIRQARRVPWWPLAVGVPAVALPRGYFLTVGAATYWLVSLLRARINADDLRHHLESDLARREREVKVLGERLLVRADEADEEAIGTLFDRWMALRPEVLKTLRLDLTSQADESGESDWLIEGDAVTREELVDRLPESGHTQRGFAGERSASAIDKELAEVNAAAMLSLMWALFAGPSRHRVQVRLMIQPPGGGEALQWVWLRATVNEQRLRSAIATQGSAVDAMKVLGGDVGRCFAGQYSPARTDPNPSGFYSLGRLDVAKRLTAPAPMQQIDAPYVLLLTSGTAPTIVSTSAGAEVHIPKRADAQRAAEGVKSEGVAADAPPEEPNVTQPVVTKAAQEREAAVESEAIASTSEASDDLTEAVDEAISQSSFAEVESAVAEAMDEIAVAAAQGAVESTPSSEASTTELAPPDVTTDLQLPASADHSSQPEIDVPLSDAALAGAHDLFRAIEVALEAPLPPPSETIERPRKPRMLRDRSEGTRAGTFASSASSTGAPALKLVRDEDFEVPPTPPPMPNESDRTTLATPAESEATQATPPTPASTSETPFAALPTLVDVSTNTPVYAPLVPGLRGERFATTAQEYVEFEGSTSAAWVPFKAEPAGYAAMDAMQLAYYFRWRNALRHGAAIRSDVGYIYTHAYELLHVIGAPNATDAAWQLERLWLAYRESFPQIDDYLVSWTADLLTTEVDQESALSLIERALLAGARLRDDETMLIVDRYWHKGDYSALPNAAIALLVGDPFLWEGKFYQTHNAGPVGSGWIDRAYREALSVTDAIVAATTGRTPRDIAIARHGRTEVGRAAFSGALYDYGRKSAVLGLITSLPHAAPVSTTYRNALRFVDELLRESKGYPIESRVKPPRRELADALRERFGNPPRDEGEAPSTSVVVPPPQDDQPAIAAAGSPPVVPETLPPPALASSTSEVSDAAQRMIAFFEQPPLPPGSAPTSFNQAVPDDFGPVELEVLRLISREPNNVRRFENPKTLLRELATRHDTTPWLLIHRVNQVARRTPFGNRVIDINSDPPRIHEQARSFVQELIAKMQK